jgi:hypothetical protein
MPPPDPGIVTGVSTEAMEDKSTGRTNAASMIGKLGTCDGTPAKLRVLEQSGDETLPCTYVHRRILRRS